MTGRRGDDAKRSLAAMVAGVSILLAAACGGDPQGTTGDASAADAAAADGRTVDAATGDAEVTDGGGPACEGPESCDDGVDCTVDDCLDEHCVHVVDHSRCDPGLLCDPVRGCATADGWICHGCPGGPSDCPGTGDLCAPVDGDPVCLLSCEDGGACPVGFSCEALLDDGQPLGNACTPDYDTCCLDVDGDGAGLGDQCAFFDCDETNELINEDATERCDATDHDCDGDPLNGFPVGGACDSEDSDQCALGTYACDVTSGDVVCLNETVINIVESCDGSDNDCDGHVDNAPGVATDYSLTQACSNLCGAGNQRCAAEGWSGCDATALRACYTATAGCAGDDGGPYTCTGACRAGTELCADGTWIGCADEVVPIDESCDGADNDCDGYTDNTQGVAADYSLTKVCANTCGVGDQTCGPAGWSDCDATNNRTCYDGATGCSGSPGEAYTCTGECRAGTQDCSAGAWEECTGDRVPTPEACDGDDDDCDGYTDNNPGVATAYTLTQGCINTCGSGNQTCGVTGWGGCDAVGSRSCYDGATGCTGSPGGTYSCVGWCRSGTQSCAGGSWGACDDDVLPRTEQCDGVDDNCDGYTDNNPGVNASYTLTRSCSNSCGTGTQTCSPTGWTTCNATGSRSCYSGPWGCLGSPGDTYSCTGTCSAGTQSCANGLWDTCSGDVHPSVEICRDSMDQDCDHVADDICGQQSYAYARVSGAGVLSLGRTITGASKVATGTYALTVSSSSYYCPARGLFITPTTGMLRPTSFYCSGNDFRVLMGAAGGGLSDRGFHAVITPKIAGEGWAVVAGDGTVERSYGSTTAVRTSTGRYTVTNARCNTLYQPVFTSIYASSLVGYSKGRSGGGGVCYVYTYDLNGVAADRGFAIWIVDRDAAAWAMVEGWGGTVEASNDFSDYFANWTSQRVESGGVLDYFDVRFPAWSSAGSVALVSPGNTSADLMTGMSVISGGVRVHTYDISTNTIDEGDFNVLFIQ